MSEHSSTLPPIGAAAFARQRERLDELEADTGDLAARVADLTWSEYRKQAEDSTDGYTFDDRSMYLTTMGMCVQSAFDESFERVVERAFARLRDDLAQHEAEAFDFFRLNLEAMRFGIELQKEVRAWLETELEKAEPKLGSMVGLAFGNLFRDTSEQVDAETKFHADKAKRTRRALLSIQSRLQESVERKTRGFIEEACRDYRAGLERLERERSPAAA
jgi:hypothetical protein